MVAFSENLRKLRKNKGLTRQFMADELGISLSAYGYYESNNGYPTVERLIKIANLLGVSVDELLNYKEDDFEHFKAEWIAAGFNVEELEDGRILLTNTPNEPRFDVTAEFWSEDFAAVIFGFSRQEFINLSSKAYINARAAALSEFQKVYGQEIAKKSNNLTGLFEDIKKVLSKHTTKQATSSPAAAV